ncbi:MAG TPA: nuclear transport factor 2 family protein [Segeticoccus sp.]|uniref:ester cyclase n=1 Tax=Segeticoccus sp. TaxID=2706531 RepID=UPI002D7EF513|nr:nuclear transport factor 2 family protein [Segeticoccus sp.]HET8600246.1 nuclear transport factor 2 family protein [Segeticoccus sp.]
MGRLDDGKSRSSTDSVVTVPLDAVTLRRFVDDWHAAWNSHDPRQVTALCAEDIEYSDPLHETPRRGTHAIQEVVVLLARAMPDFRFASTALPLFDSARGVAVVPWRCVGTMKGPLEPPGFAPTNGTVSFDGDDHWTLLAGRLTSCRVLYDQYAVARQIGAVPPADSRGERLGVWLQRLAARGLRRRRAA